MKRIGTWISFALLLGAMGLGAGTAFGDLAPPPRHPGELRPRPRPKPTLKPLPKPEADAGATSAAGAGSADAGAISGEADAGAAAVAPAAKPERAAARLPDGVFTGALTGPDGEVGELTLMVVGGMIIDAHIGAQVGALVELLPTGAPYDPNISLRARGEGAYGSITGRFFDVDRGAGTFDGMLGRKSVRGTWVAARR